MCQQRIVARPDAVHDGQAHVRRHQGQFAAHRVLLWDDDRKLLDPECFPDFISNRCGDSAYGHTNIDISTPGTHTFSVHAYGIQNSLDVIAYGKVVVTFY